MNGYTIRAFIPDDLPRLREITAATFGPVSIDRNLEERLGAFGPRDWKERKCASIDDDCRVQPDGVFVAVAENGDIAGYVTTRLNHASKLGGIPNLAVAPDHQRHGLGRALLETALAFLTASGMEVAKIETLEQNPIGQTLYPSLGFVEIARQIHYARRLR